MRRESFGSIRKLPSGRLQARYYGADGERHNAPMTFTTKTDARAWLAQQQAALAMGTWRSPGSISAAKITLGEFSEQWLLTRTGRSGVELRDRTLHEYQRLLRRTLAPLLKTALKDVTPDAVRRWHASMLKTGRTTQTARSYGLLRSIMQTAVDDGLISSNPCKIRGAGSARTGKKVEPPTPVELDLIVETMPQKYRAMVLVAAWGGLRFGELTELRRKDLVKVEDYYIVTVSRAVTHTPAGYSVGPTKSEAGVRSIALPHHITPAIDAHLIRTEQVGNDFRPARNLPPVGYPTPDGQVVTDVTTSGPDVLLFPAANGGHLAQTTLVRSFYPARAAAGRPDMPFHALRHYGATRFAQTGATLKEIQARLGHSTVSAAMRYQHVANRDVELVRRMAELANE